MPRTWNRGDARQFAKQLKLGATYYYVNHHSDWATPKGDDLETYSTVVFTQRLPLTGTPCTDGGFSAHTLCQNFGPIYDTAPRGMRHSAVPAPSCLSPADMADIRNAGSAYGFRPA